MLGGTREHSKSLSLSPSPRHPPHPPRGIHCHHTLVCSSGEVLFALHEGGSGGQSVSETCGSPSGVFWERGAYASRGRGCAPASEGCGQVSWSLSLGAICLGSCIPVLTSPGDLWEPEPCSACYMGEGVRGPVPVPMPGGLQEAGAFTPVGPQPQWLLLSFCGYSPAFLS